MAKRQPKDINLVIAPASVTHPRHSEGSILTFDDGRLLLGWSEFYGSNWQDWGAARISARWSKDEGLTWGEPFVLQENTGRLNCMLVSFLRLASGRVLFTFNRRDGQPDVPGGPPYCQTMVRWSDDDCRTWSDPKPIMAADRYWDPANDRLAQHSSGRILLPVTGTNHASEGTVISCFYSDDDGATWQMSPRNIMPPQGRYYAEPVVVELANGSVAMYLRGNLGNIHIALSHDRGESWKLHKTHPLNMSGHPECGPNSAEAPSMVKRVPGSNDLLLVWNQSNIRTPLTAAISSDHGETWRYIRNLEEVDGFPPRFIYCYPSIAFLKGNVHLSYFACEAHPVAEWLLSQKYRRLPLSWFYEKP